MPRVCSVCTHGGRNEIDRALVAGETFRDIAVRFGTSAMALHRHKQEHLPTLLTKAHEAADVAQAGDLLTQIRGLQTRTMTILDKAEAAGRLGDGGDGDP